MKKPKPAENPGEKHYKVKTKDSTTARRQGVKTRDAAANPDGSFSVTTGKKFDANVTKVKEISPKRASRLETKANKMAGTMSGSKETGEAGYTKSVMGKTEKKTGGSVTSMKAFKASDTGGKASKAKKTSYVATVGPKQSPVRPDVIARIKGPEIKTKKLVAESTLSQKSDGSKKPGKTITKTPVKKTGVAAVKKAPVKPVVKKSPPKAKTSLPKFAGTYKVKYEN